MYVYCTLLFLGANKISKFEKIIHLTNAYNIIIGAGVGIAKGVSIGTEVAVCK